MGWRTVSPAAALSLLLFAAVMNPAAAQNYEPSSDDHEHHQSLKSTAIVCILIVILFLTLAFELIYEFVFETLEHKKMGYLKDIANALFKEMTILGFISLIIFSLTRCGFLMQINDAYIGQNRVEVTAIEELTAEHENPYAAPTTLFELFEEVHIFVFVLMITFALVVGGLLCVAAAKTYEWRRYEDTKDDDFKEMVENDSISAAHLEYWIVCAKFTNPGQLLMMVPYGSLDMPLYFSDCLTKLLIELIEIPPSTWICLIPVAFLFRPVMDFCPAYAVVFSYVATLAFLLFTLAFYKELEIHKAYFYPERSVIIDHIKDTKDYRHLKPTPLGDVDLQPVVQQNEKIMNWFPGIRRFINRHEAAFAFTVKGPAYLQRLMQLLVFLHALIIAILMKTYLSIHSRELFFGPFGPVVGILPLAIILLSLSMFPKIAVDFVFLTSTGFYLNKEVYQNQRETWMNQRIKRHKQILDFLYTRALTEVVPKESRKHQQEILDAQRDYELLSDAQQRVWQELFLMFTSGPFYKETDADVLFVTLSEERLKDMLDTFEVRKTIKDLDARLEDLKRFLYEPDKPIHLNRYILVLMRLFRDHNPRPRKDKLQKDKSLLMEYLQKVDEDGDGIISEDAFRGMLGGIEPTIDDREMHQLLAAIAAQAYSAQIPIEQIAAWVDGVESRFDFLTPTDDVVPPRDFKW